MEKSGVALLKEFFTHPPLTIDELKTLSVSVRQELADAVAVELKYNRVEKDGKIVYVKA